MVSTSISGLRSCSARVLRFSFKKDFKYYYLSGSFFLTLSLFHSLLPAPISAECGTDSVRWIKKGIKIVAVVKIVTTAKYLQGKVVRAIVRGILVTVVDGAFVDVGTSVVVSPSVVGGMLLHKLVLQQN